MCGIAGIISPRNQVQEVEEMLESIAHRGPDARGIYSDEGYATIGHNRLSIIDLSADANQPFHDNSGRYHLSFNGEIYNYKELKQEIGSDYVFRTSSDTEVLLASYILYGKDCLNKLNGMFSFVIWDSRDKRLFAARDRFGVKPFFYYKDNLDLIFASEIKAIKRVKNTSPNEKVWANYFCHGSYGQTEETFYKNIHQLPAGHFFEYKSGKLAIQKWYNFVERINGIQYDYSKEEIKKHYLDLLIDSIRLRFRSDVKLGFNLSGGVDSSLLLALVNHYKKSDKISAFTFYTGNKRYDELPWVEKMISQTKNPLNKVKLTAAEVPEIAKYISHLQDEPFGGIPSIAYAKIFEQARDMNIKVLLDGQGMDEQWAGYDYYTSQYDSVVQGTGKLSSFKPNVLNRDFENLAKKPEYPTPFTSRLQNLQYRDFFYTKMPRALRFNDRISMAYSTELREPFLDYRLVEFAFSLPDSMKIYNGVHKYMLREITKEFVSQKISEAPKRALQTPQREWLGAELKNFTSESLFALESGRFKDWFDFELLQKEWRNYQEGSKQNSFFLWQWINTSLLAEIE